MKIEKAATLQRVAAFSGKVFVGWRSANLFFLGEILPSISLYGDWKLMPRSQGGPCGA